MMQTYAMFGAGFAKNLILFVMMATLVLGVVLGVAELKKELTELGRVKKELTEMCLSLIHI